MPWWSDVDWDWSTIDWLGCGWHDAERIEWAAIAEELPWYNKTHLPESRDGWPWNPRFPDGVPRQPWTREFESKAEYWRAWFEWRAVLREHLLNPEERSGRRSGDSTPMPRQASPCARRRPHGPGSPPGSSRALKGRQSPVMGLPDGPSVAQRPPRPLFPVLCPQIQS
jgi:hypothetical protein